MKALDTNVLVRFLVRDDFVQSEAVYRILKRYEKEKQQLWIPMVVVLETLWVLESVYEITRENIVGTLDDLLMMPVLKFEAQPAVRNFVSSALKSNTELSDLFIAFCAHHSGCTTVLTFDKKAAKSTLFELIPNK